MEFAFMTSELLLPFPSAQFGERVKTIFLLKGRGRNFSGKESQVFRPMITGLF